MVERWDRRERERDGIVERDGRVERGRDGTVEREMGQ